MHIRSLALLGAVLLGASSAFAQFTELLLEAPVTLTAELKTNTVTTTATSRTSALVTTKLDQAKILEELRVAGIITTPTTTDWSLVAVRAPAADLTQVSPAFSLYAINRKLNLRQAVPSGKFGAAAFGSADAYTELHQGQYVYSSTGSRSAHVRYDYRPVFTAGGSSFTVTSAQTDGLARIKFTARDVSDDYEMFIYAITSFTASTQGGFTATVTSGNARPNGVITLTVNVGAAKLVDASLYPAVEPNPFNL